MLDPNKREKMNLTVNQLKEMLAKHYETNAGWCAKGNTHGYADTWTCGDAEGR